MQNFLWDGKKTHLGSDAGEEEMDPSAGDAVGPDVVEVAEWDGVEEFGSLGDAAVLGVFALA